MHQDINKLSRAEWLFTVAILLSGILLAVDHIHNGSAFFVLGIWMTGAAVFVLVMDKLGV